MNANAMRRVLRERGLVPLTLVLIALAALAVVPLLIMRETDGLRDRITRFAAPARALTTRIQSAIALESAATRGYVLTGDAKWVDEFRIANGQLERAISELRPLGTELGEAVTSDIAALTARLEPANILLDSLYSGHLTRGDYLSRLGDQQQRLEAALSAAGAIDRTIDSVTAATLTRSRSVQRIGAVVTVSLVVLALVAAGLVANLSRKYRAIAIELDESERRFRQITEAIDDFVWLSDASFKTHFYANTAYERIWGRPLADLYRDPSALLDGVHPDDRERVTEALGKLPHGTYDIEFRVVRPDGQLRWVWSRGFPVRNERGEIFRIAGITEDITDRKLAGESRTRLIRGFTHDVKNPLGAADGFLALLEEGIQGELGPKQRESVGRVRKSIKAALDLIAQLLDIARAEAGQLETVRRPMDIIGTVREVTEEFRAQAQAKGLRLALEVPDGMDSASLEVISDRARVRQVVANLVSNAVKYTPEGKVDIAIRRTSDGDAPAPGSWVAVRVSDSGPGIPAEKQGLLFREFTRFAPDAASGSGIGLAISQRVAHALNGTITVKSDVGVGTTFTLWIPVDARVSGRRTEDRNHPGNQAV